MLVVKWFNTYQCESGFRLGNRDGYFDSMEAQIAAELEPNGFIESIAVVVEVKNEKNAEQHQKA